jgi:predicted GNAT family acetyltransferase
MSSAAAAPIDVRHDAAAQRFEAVVEGRRAELDYQLTDNVMRIFHTGVPPALQGRGIAAELARAALDHARGAGWHVEPACSYVRSYMRRHPETQDLLAT